MNAKSVKNDITPVDPAKVSVPPNMESIAALTTCVERLQPLSREEQVRILAAVREFLGLDNEGATVINKTIVNRPLGGAVR